MAKFWAGLLFLLTLFYGMAYLKFHYHYHLVAVLFVFEATLQIGKGSSEMVQEQKQGLLLSTMGMKFGEGWQTLE